MSENDGSNETSKEIAVKRDFLPTSSGVPLMDTAMFEHMGRIAKTMAYAPLTPAHLKGANMDQAVANCMMVVNQAYRWGFDPLAVAQCTYVVSGKLGYEGKLIAALINVKAGIKERLSYSYSYTAFNGEAGDDKKPEDLTITAYGTFEGEDEVKEVSVRVGDVKTENKMWIRDPKQKLIYNAAIKWARAWCPELILGVQIQDDLEFMQEHSGEWTMAPEALPGQAAQRPSVTNGQSDSAESEQPAQEAAEAGESADEEAINDTWEVADELGELTEFEELSEAANRLIQMLRGKVTRNELNIIWENNEHIIRSVDEKVRGIMERSREDAFDKFNKEDARKKEEAKKMAPPAEGKKTEDKPTAQKPEDVKIPTGVPLMNEKGEDEATHTRMTYWFDGLKSIIGGSADPLTVITQNFKAYEVWAQMHADYADAAWKECGQLANDKTPKK